MHFDEGGDLEKAVTYWLLAGDEALARSAQTEAAAYFNNALEALSRTSDDEERKSLKLSILLRLGQAQFGSLGGAAENTQALCANLKVEWLDPVFTKGLPKEETFEQLDALANQIAERHKGLN